MFNSTVGAALRGRPQIRIVKPRVFASAGLRPSLKLLLQNGGGHEGRPCNRRNGGGRKEKAARAPPGAESGCSQLKSVGKLESAPQAN